MVPVGVPVPSWSGNCLPAISTTNTCDRAMMAPSCPPSVFDGGDRQRGDALLAADEAHALDRAQLEFEAFLVAFAFERRVVRTRREARSQPFTRTTLEEALEAFAFGQRAIQERR